jgi:hypothetical protein
MNINEIKRRNYDYWCSLSKHYPIKIFKDKISYLENGKEVYILKSKLEQI